MNHRLLASGLLLPLAVAPASGWAQGRSVYYALPSWSPDGAVITFESNREGEPAVYTIRPDGSGLKRLTPAGTPSEQPAWAPDGRSLVYTSTDRGTRQLYRMTPDGAEPTPLPQTVNGFLATFSPDGLWLLFAAQDTVPSLVYHIVVMHPDGSARRRLGDSAMSNEDPRWTTDGERIVFSQVPALTRRPDETPRDFLRRREAGRRWVGMMPDGGHRQELDRETVEEISRRRELSPDGRELIVVKTVEGTAGLFILDLVSGAERRLDPPPGS